ncbi:hypothetical protein TTHERM_000189269 (macronuclear) [Tetrahymena thermophila SB210]|uniref:Uncharacterized protein n=1 Tax=Tetrahymena thermophila (strain SB210) TaxID=312017 RepID=W7X4H9_TETTS|nr:hypothetical protein TTHERM_000189269 [Tetrahymena thermophila SB210]EWS74240.1 hypothetical protein TTHERM_000189269 [Tetrahymena thermophila SB210]|eukprot:XP_012653213.1 hypothetical protein TTHERM_000189269 [Tetrahymena thermophila SB210]
MEEPKDNYKQKFEILNKLYKNLEHTCIETQTKIEYMNKKKDTLKKKIDFLKLQLNKLNDIYDDYPQQ